MNETIESSRPRNRVSVIIPVYNAEPFLQRALDSVRSQTAPPCEVICVDDGSTDTSPHIASSYDARGAFTLRVIKLPQNLGVAAARNRGWDAALGDYVAFLDADDVWASDKLTCQLRAIEQDELDFIGGHSGQLAPLASLPITPLNRKITIEKPGLLAAMLSNPFHTSSVLLRRDITRRFPENGHLSEDYALWLQMIASEWRCGRHAQHLSYMFKRPFGASGLSARIWKMQKGELIALTSFGWRKAPHFLPLALAISCLKFCTRLLRK